MECMSSPDTATQWCDEGWTSLNVEFSLQAVAVGLTGIKMASCRQRIMRMMVMVFSFEPLWAGTWGLLSYRCIPLPGSFHLSKSRSPKILWITSTGRHRWAQWAMALGPRERYGALVKQQMQLACWSSASRLSCFLQCLLINNKLLSGRSSNKNISLNFDIVWDKLVCTAVLLGRNNQKNNTQPAKVLLCLVISKCWHWGWCLHLHSDA